LPPGLRSSDNQVIGEGSYPSIMSLSARWDQPPVRSYVPVALAAQYMATQSIYGSKWEKLESLTCVISDVIWCIVQDWEASMKGDCYGL
jgi:hypothetical protein